jgi:serine/threonine protein kinase
VGTQGWRAPELNKKQRHSFVVDIWSLGMVLLRLAVNIREHNFSSTSPTSLNISKELQQFKTCVPGRKLYWDLLEKMLQKTPHNRITSEQAEVHFRSQENSLGPVEKNRLEMKSHWNNMSHSDIEIRIWSE